MTDIRRVWTRLGFMFASSPTDEPPNPEKALVAGLSFARDDARLFTGMATWLHRYGGLVDGRQLTRAFDEATGVPSALLGALITASRSPALRGVASHCEPLEREEVLFTVMDNHPVLQTKVREHPLRAYRHWGLLVDHLELKPDALRPSSWVLRMNPILRIRALLGPNLAAATVIRLLEPGAPASISALARDLRRSYASVHSTVGALQARGLVETATRGRSNAVSIPEDVAAWLASYPGALQPAQRIASRGG